MGSGEHPIEAFNSRRRMTGRVLGIGGALAALAIIVCMWPRAGIDRGLTALKHSTQQVAQKLGLTAAPLYADEGNGSASKGGKTFAEMADHIFGGDITPERAICDPFPEFNGVAVDPANNLAVFTAPNVKRLVLYHSQAGSDSSQPTDSLGIISGEASRISGESGVALDPVKREIYAVDTDIGNTLVAFPYSARGNAAARILSMPVGAYGLAISQRYRQIAITNEDDGVIMFFRLGAKGVENPLRELRGDHTGLAEPKGLFWDDQHHELIVENVGDINRGKWDADYSGGGRYNPPSITVYSDQAKDDSAPLRKIQGNKTQLNDPVGLAVDLAHNEIYIANIGNNSITVYARDGQGNAAPVRVIKGPHTNIQSPIGLAYDAMHNELWVANFGHTAEIFDRTANGDATPKRLVRSAPAGTPTVGVVLPQALAFDSKRNQILVGH
ncbi:MAG TPA: hypothetical protein VKV28_04575 [Candidatus Binataceae bacterium]|nr:hypothetical protein [Candidatus Binataceae bacterium]